MSNLMHIYHATMVKRWHTNPHMSDTGDPVGYHSGRMAVLALKLWPCDWETLAACLTHDLGEFVSGDIPYDGDKTTANAVADEWSIDNELDWHVNAKNQTKQRLKFLDKLDAYLWARHHNPKLVKKEKAWQSQRDWLLCEGKQLGVDLCLFNM